MASLLDRIGALFGRSQPPTQITTAEDLPRRRADPVDLIGTLQAETERRRLVRACQKMYAEDPRASGVIQAVARDMVHGGFTVSVTAGRRDAATVAAALNQRLSLTRQMDDWAREAMIDGDVFLELAVNGSNEIVEVSAKPTLQMRRSSDDRDHFPDPARAYWQGPEYSLGEGAPGEALWFAEWQIIHGRWQHDRKSRYGTPLFAPAASAYKRIREGETDIAVRRKTRAGIKYNHRFPEGTTADQIDAYKETNRDMLDDPTAAIADFFGTAEIQVVAGEGGALEAIGDVMHHIRTWWLAAPVPMSLLGYGQDLNRDVLDAQQEQYQQALIGLTEWLETEIVKPLLERQWLLAGIDPAGLTYEIKWRTRETLKAVTLVQVADAVLKLIAAGIPRVMAWEMAERFLPGVDLTAAKAEMALDREDDAEEAPRNTQNARRGQDGLQNREDGQNGQGREDQQDREEGLILAQTLTEYQKAAAAFERLLDEFNPYHKPAGPGGGQFARAPGAGAAGAGTIWSKGGKRAVIGAGEEGPSGRPAYADEADEAIGKLLALGSSYDSQFASIKAERKTLSDRSHNLIEQDWTAHSNGEAYDGAVRTGIRAELSKTSTDISDLRKRENDLLERMNEEAHTFLQVGNPSSITPNMLSKFNGTRASEIREGTQMFARFVSKDVLPNEMSVDFEASGRGRASFGWTQINVSTAMGRSAVAHELGHWLEHTRPDVFQKSSDFLDRRRGDERAQSLNKILNASGYRSNEIAYKDQFDDPYSGKEYSYRGRRIATEILSMGIQHFVERPTEFARSDPDYFRFVYNTVRGR